MYFFVDSTRRIFYTIYIEERYKIFYITLAKKDTKMSIYEFANVRKEVEVSINETSEEILAKYKNKSEAMRALSKDYTTSQIAKMLNVRYQFVNNVLKEALRNKK